MSLTIIINDIKEETLGFISRFTDITPKEIQEVPLLHTENVLFTQAQNVNMKMNCYHPKRAQNQQMEISTVDPQQQ